MAERDIRINVRVEVTNLEALKTFTAALQQAAASEKVLSKAALQKNEALKRQKSVVGDDTNATNRLNRSVKSLTQTIVSNIGKVLQWLVATTAVIGSLRLLRTAIQDIMEVDFAIAGLTKVMGDASDRSKRLSGDVQVLASAYGELGSVVIASTTEWARLQLANNELAVGTTASLLAQAVAEMSVVDATKYLVAELKQFKAPALDAVRIIDQWNELSNTFAVRATDVARAAARAGSVMRNTGVEMERLHAYTTALVQSTGRAGTEIGNALRTFGVYAYRVQTVGNLSREAGIQIEDMAGAQKGLGDIIREVAINWSTYTDVQRSHIAQQIAGTRRTNEFIALMEEYPVVLDAMVQSWRATGSAYDEATIFMNTVQKRADQLRSRLQRLVTEGGVLAGGLKELLKILNDLVEGFIALRPVLVAGGLALAAWTLYTTGALEAVRLWTWYLTGLHPVLIAVTAAITIGTIALGRYRRAKQEAMDMDERAKAAALGEAKAKESEAERLRTLIDIYNNLRGAMASGQTTPGLFNARQLAEMESKLGDIARRITQITGIPTNRLALETYDWATAIGEAETKYRELSAAGKQAIAEQTAVWETNISTQEKTVALLENISRAWKELAGGVYSSSQATELLDRAIGKTGLSISQADKILKEMGLDIRKAVSLGEIGDVAAKWGIVEKALVGVDEAYANAVATLEQYRSRLKSLQGEAGVLGDVLMPEDIDLILDKADMGLADITERIRHRVAEAKKAGKTEVEQNNIINAGLGERLEYITKVGDKYSDVEKIVSEVEDRILKMLAEELGIRNAIIEAGWTDDQNRLNKELNDYVSTMGAASAATMQFMQHSGGVIASTKAQIQYMKQEAAFRQKDIDQRKEKNLATKDEQAALDMLNSKILYQEQLLGSVIIPMEDYRKATEAISSAEENAITIMEAAGASRIALARRSERAAEARLEEARKSGDQDLADQRERELERARINSRVAESDLERMQSLQRVQTSLDKLAYSQDQYIRHMELAGKSEYAIAQQRVKDAREFLIVTLRNLKNMGDMAAKVQAITSAFRDLTNAQLDLEDVRVKSFRDNELKVIEAQQMSHDHAIALMEARGASETEMLAVRKEQLQDELQTVKNANKMADDEKKQRVLSLYRDLKQIGYDYEVAEVKRAYDIADAYVSQYQRVEESWKSMIERMAGGQPLQALKQEMDRLFAIWMRKGLENSPLLKGFAEAERGLSGLSPEKIAAEEKNRREMVASMLEGGQLAGREISNAMVSAGKIIAGDFREAGDKVSNEISGGTGGAGTGGMGDSALASMLQSDKFWAAYGGARTIAGNVNQPGGFARTAGWGIGFGGGLALSGGNVQAAMMTAMITSEVVGMIQGLMSDKADKEKARGPATESLRGQLQSNIARGQFREAANITYNTQNYVSLGFMIPDSAQMARVIPIIKEGLKSYDKNIGVAS